MASALLLSLLLSLLASASVSAEIWNIDCGATETWLQPYTNLTWVPDGDYVRSGVNHVVANATGVAKKLATLRAFPEKRKNCYTVPVGAETKVQVWVSFYYGNYDGLEKPPSFELLLDGNDWMWVDTVMDQRVDYTILYTAARSSTDICFGRTADDQVPFVTTIQVVTFGSEMYSKVNSSTALHDPIQIAFGAPEDIRSPDDPYDRIWLHGERDITVSTNNTVVTNATTMHTGTCPDHPPAKLFETAVTPLGGSTNLTIDPTYFPSTRQGIYLNMYFTEVNGTTLRGKRMFDVYLDDELISNASDPIAPRVGEATELSYVTFDAKVSSDTVFTLAPTKGSALPPIISGFETWRMYKFLGDATSDVDVNALAKLQEKFKVLRNWSGDPCLPETYNWEWVSCSSDASPRITTLSLGGYGLSGSLPDFSALDALVSIDLHNNSFGGAVPEFLARFPELRKLNLAYNNFTSVPASLIGNTRIRLNITGNPIPGINEAPPPSNPDEMQKDGSGKDAMPASILVLLITTVIVAVAAQDL